MKTLLVLDEKNYQDTVRVLEKFAVRGIIRKKGKLAVQQAGKKEYKLLGGGVEKGENLLQTLQREIREEGDVEHVAQAERLECAVGIGARHLGSDTDVLHRHVGL